MRAPDFFDDNLNSRCSECTHTVCRSIVSRIMCTGGEDMTGISAPPQVSRSAYCADDGWLAASHRRTAGPISSAAPHAGGGDKGEVFAFVTQVCSEIFPLWWLLAIGRIDRSASMRCPLLIQQVFPTRIRLPLRWRKKGYYSSR
jgi:hypothetical protein